MNDENQFVNVQCHRRRCRARVIKTHAFHHQGSYFCSLYCIGMQKKEDETVKPTPAKAELAKEFRPFVLE